RRGAHRPPFRPRRSSASRAAASPAGSADGRGRGPSLVGLATPMHHPRMTTRTSRHVAILAGGKGTRFWPVGRASRPKQILALDGADPRPLLLATYQRVAPLCDAKGPWVVASKALGPAIRRLLPRLARERLVLEPVPRNTAGAM